MKNEILAAANLYAQGVKHVQDRRDQWMKKHGELEKHLKAVAENLNANADYKQGFFVDTLQAFDENINGVCATMPSVTLRTGSMPMLVMFRNSMGEKREYIEQGFHITFTPTITGQIIVFLIPHQNELNKTPAEYSTLAIIDEPGKLNMDAVDTIVSKGIELAFYTSFTGMSEQQDDQQPQAPHAHSPIGFKLHETTEQVK